MPNEGQEWIEGEIAFHRDGYGQVEAFMVFVYLLLVYVSVFAVLTFVGVE